MRVQRWFWFGSALLAAMLAACGSGSSGFDISPDVENLAIVQVLDESQCRDLDRLTLCPSDDPTASVPMGNTGPVQGSVQVQTDLAGATDSFCTPADTERGCSIDFLFMPIGLPADAAYRVAARPLEPTGTWEIGPEPVMFGTPESPSFGAAIAVGPEVETLQVAVLVFLDPQAAFAGPVDTLSVSGAAFAFVTQEVVVLR